jgi:paraquat-inducible protein B
MAFVNRGLRAELQTANLLTGSLYISLTMIEGAKPPKRLIAELPFEVPTVESAGIDQIQKQLASIVASIDKIPFEKLAAELGVAVTEVTALTKTLDKNLAPELSATLKQVQKTLAEVDGILVSGSPLPAQLDNSLKEMDRAVRATRSLIDELRAKPNSIIFGEATRPYSRETLGVGP